MCYTHVFSWGWCAQSKPMYVSATLVRGMKLQVSYIFLPSLLLSLRVCWFSVSVKGSWMSRLPFQMTFPMTSETSSTSVSTPMSYSASPHTSCSIIPSSPPPPSLSTLTPSPPHSLIPPTPQPPHLVGGHWQSSLGSFVQT